MPGPKETSNILIVPNAPAFVTARIGGLSVLLRAVCAAARAADTVSILRTAICTPGVVGEIEREVRRRENLAPVRWVDAPDAVPLDGALVVIAEAVVFEPATIKALVTDARSARRTLRCRDHNQAPVDMWCAPPGQGRPLLDGLLPGAEPTAPRTIDASAADAGGTLLERISDESSRQLAETRLLQHAGKQSDSLVARFFDRRISAAITRPLLATATTPNQVTIVNAMVGLVGAALLLPPYHAVRVFGAFLLVLTVILDGCDGEIARVKYLESNYGRLLDFFTDNAVNATAILTTGLGHYLRGGHGFFYYASVTTFVLVLASVAPVYFLFFREHKAAVAAGGSSKQGGAYGFAESLSSRDFVYLIFLFAIPNRIHWFTPIALVGLSVFLVFVSTLAVRHLIAGARELPDASMLNPVEGSE